MLVSAPLPRLDAATSDWLAARRDVLNGRLEGLRQRHPKAPATRILAGIGRHLPAHLRAASDDDDTKVADVLVEAVFDLVAMHAARDSLRWPAVDLLFSDVLLRPSVRRLCLAAPTQLPAALSNALDRLSHDGVQWLKTLAGCAAGAQTSDELLKAGGVIAWRLGEPRLRQAALDVAGEMGDALFLSAMGLDDLPEVVAPILRAGLVADGWVKPRQLIYPALADALMAMSEQRRRDRVAKLVKEAGKIDASAPLQTWRQTHALGDFIGFGGRFKVPPKLDSFASRHELYVEAGEGVFRIDADVFGCRTTPVSLDAVPGIGEKAPAPAQPSKALAANAEQLRKIGAIKGVHSWLSGPEVVGWTLTDSYRVRLMIPPPVELTP